MRKLGDVDAVEVVEVALDDDDENVVTNRCCCCCSCCCR